MAETVFYVAAAIAAVAGAGASVYSATKSPPKAKVPPYKPPPPPPPPKEEKKEVAVPGVEEKDIGAGAMDERRRILAALPNQTKNTYGGDAIQSETVVAKKRLLGEGVGKSTIGA